MFGDVVATLLFLLNPPPPPPEQPASEGSLTAEQQAQYEAEYNSCAGAWDPDQCRADPYERYYG
ncbi:hypothetical protein [Sphingomonas lenta]|uniref:Uncharacterized protein n=1 Tax=Sphingomonas lenta TaxID=1141887 RepID=A0A2A2SHN1_9SPHN|nr:hypothetical protein [Sphingomonas lenta]PAX08728.1 hypothetical protein CKY28_05040 [Sphingomonas lenta]